MEIEKYKIIQMLNEEEDKNGDIYYLLYASNGWESEKKLSSLNSSLVKNYLSSNSKALNKTEEWYKHMGKNFDIDERKSTISADNIKEDPNNEYVKITCSDEIDLSSHLCDKKFSSNSDWKGHQLAPTDKHFTCSICDQRFAHSSALKRHQVTHTGDKPFACNICDKRFAYNSKLKIHQLTHTSPHT